MRVLQEKEVERLGSSESVPVDARVIAATNIPLQQLIQKGLFREDLFYRLNIMNVTLPPLRKRKEDIALLVDNIILKLNQQLGRNIKGVTNEALVYLKNKDWPGNVRELHNALERAVNTSLKDELTIDSFTAGDYYEENSEPYIGNKQEPDYEDARKSLIERKGSLEKEAIISALEVCGQNRSKTAKMLNISRTLLYKKMEKYQISG